MSAHDPNRHAFIDALRGLAALAVIYLHMAGALTAHGLASGPELTVLTFFRETIDIGKVGVVVFFAISGFVIPFTLLRRGVAPIRTFVVNRIFRLYPAYWLSLLCAVLAAWVVDGVRMPARMVAVNLTMLQQFVGVENVLALYWTLQIELVFYALCVLLFAMGLLQQRRMVFRMSLLMLGVALALAWARHTLAMKLPVALPLALSVMFWGCVWRDYVIDGDAESRREGWMFIIVFVLCIPVISLLAYDVDMGFGETWTRYTFSYCTALAILVLGTTILRLEGPVMVWLGKVSYSVYLLGSIVSTMVLTWVVPHFETRFPAHAYIVLVMPLTLLAAWGSYRGLELPLIRMGRRLNARFDRGGSHDEA